MNFIVLEGWGLWLILVLVLLMLIITVISLVCVVVYDNRIIKLETRLYDEGKKVKYLFKRNLELSFKSGELDVDEE